MAWSDLNTWSIVDRETLLDEFKAELKRPAFSNGGALSIRSTIKPVDLYGYLVGRFGEPNGLQSLLLTAALPNSPKPDSGNIIHWDFDFKSEDTRIRLTGFTREVHIWVSQEVEDEEWLKLIQDFRADFAVFSQQKSATQKRFEKWVVFANPFVALAEACSDLHGNIVDALECEIAFKPMKAGDLKGKEYQEQLRKFGERANRIYSASLQLRVLTPILGEAFINVLTALLAKPEIKDDSETWLAYRKAPFHQKIEALSRDCLGFAHPIDQTSRAYRDFMRIRSMRNDLLHANVIPERDSLEVVYFDGKIPLYGQGGDPFEVFWKNYESWVDPQKAVDDYEAVHMFCLEVEGCLEQQVRMEFRAILDDQFPGYDQSRRRFGKLFPSRLGHFEMGPGGIRYDDQLNSDGGGPSD